MLVYGNIDESLMIIKDIELRVFEMKTIRIKIALILFFANTISSAETVNLETFENLSAVIKSKKNITLQDESPLKVIPQYSQPQRKIQTTTEASESSLSTE